MSPFEVKDCTLLVRMSGLPPAMNLRELRERVTVCSEGVLYHHFCETTLRATFQDQDYRNDFAIWAKRYLMERVLAERLGILDPYVSSGMEEMRASLIEIIDDRLGELAYVPWVRAGDEFQFMEATTVVFDTGETIQAPMDLAPAILRMTNGSIYYHFLEALRRTPLRDDFSGWLATAGEEFEPYRKALGSIDFHFHNLPHLRKELARVLLQIKETK